MPWVYEPDEDNKSIGIGAYPIHCNDSLLNSITYQEVIDLCHANATWDKLKKNNPNATLEDAIKKEFEDQIRFQVRLAREKYELCKKGMIKELAEVYDVRLEPLPTHNGKTVHDLKSIAEDIGGWDKIEVGTYVGKDVADDFINDMQPATWRAECLQHGEPASCNDNGLTYRTLKAVAEGVWEYCGLCNRGRNVA